MARFNLSRNAQPNRRLGWTSADAAGLAILPGLVRFDELVNKVGAQERYVWSGGGVCHARNGAVLLALSLQEYARFNLLCTDRMTFNNLFHTHLTCPRAGRDRPRHPVHRPQQPPRLLAARLPLRGGWRPVRSADTAMDGHAGACAVLVMEGTSGRVPCFCVGASDCGGLGRRGVDPESTKPTHSGQKVPLVGQPFGVENTGM